MPPRQNRGLATRPRDAITWGHADTETRRGDDTETRHNSDTATRVTGDAVKKTYSRIISFIIYFLKNGIFLGDSNSSLSLRVAASPRPVENGVRKFEE